MRSENYVDAGQCGQAFYKKVGTALDDRGQPYTIYKAQKKLLVDPITHEWKFGFYQSKRWNDFMTKRASVHSMTPDWAQRVRARIARCY